MLKFFYILIFISSITNMAEAQVGDTVITYFQYGDELPTQVFAIDNADFIRVIYPDSLSKLFIIRDYYKNGVLKFMGRAEDKNHPAEPLLDGDCVSFYPNGKRKNIVRYKNEKKTGLEYIFRSDGKIYAVKNYDNYPDLMYGKKYWECYDVNGNIICKKGNGKWIIYDEDFKNVIFSGKIKNEYMDSVWNGYSILGDTIKYSCNFRKGQLISGKSYDKTGNIYSFRIVNEGAKYDKGNVFDFLNDLNRHLIVPLDDTGEKMNVENVHISFIIEKDGSITNLEPVGKANPKLKKALNDALIKCGKWYPDKYYGIPYRSWLTTSLQPQHIMYNFVKRIDFKGQVIAPLKPAGDMEHIVN